MRRPTLSSSSFAEDDPIKNAAWVARCVGRGYRVPLGPPDLKALAEYLEPKTFERGSVVFGASLVNNAVWILQRGRIALYAGNPNHRVIIYVMHPGDVDGDLSLILDLPPPYTGEALDDVGCLRLDAAVFDRLLFEHPTVARRWLTSVATRLAGSQQRLSDLLGVPLIQQVARILLDESDADEVPYSQATIAALLGARRPSVNKVLKDLQGRGAIEVGYRSITLVDRGKVRSASGRNADTD